MTTTIPNATSLGFNASVNWQDERMQTMEWKVLLGIAIFITFLSTYLFIALIFYEVLKRCKRFHRTIEFETTKDQSCKSNPNSIHDSKRHNIQQNTMATHQKTPPRTPTAGRRIWHSRKIHKDKTDCWMRLLSISAAFYASCKCLTEYIELFYGTNSSEVCLGYALTTIMCNGASLISVYLLMWLRQWAVLSSQALHHLPLKRLRYFSWTLLVVMIVTFIALCLFNFATFDMKTSVRGCLFGDEGTVSQGARSASGIIFTVMFQPAMLVLLLYPLLKHIFITRKSLAIKPQEQGNNAKTRPRDIREKKIGKLIKRLFIAILLCTISDAAGVVASYILESFPAIYISLVYDYNITFGAYVIVCSFTNWRERVLPFLPKNQHSIRTKFSSAINRSQTSTVSNKNQFQV